MEDYKTRTIKTYDDNIDFFEEKFKSRTDIERRDEFNIVLDLIPGKRLLDVGSGTGEHALYFTDKRLDVTCIDFSSKMVELCKKKGLNVEYMDFEKLDFIDDSFDGIWSVCSLMHIPKSSFVNVIEKLTKMLSDNGIFYVCIIEGDGEKFIKNENVGERFCSYWSKEDLLGIFQEKYDLIKFDKVSFGYDTYLRALFRKK